MIAGGGRLRRAADFLCGCIEDDAPFPRICLKVRRDNIGVAPLRRTKHDLVRANLIMIFIKLSATSLRQ